MITNGQTKIPNKGCSAYSYKRVAGFDGVPVGDDKDFIRVERNGVAILPNNFLPFVDWIRDSSSKLQQNDFTSSHKALLRVFDA
jgi:hypothetical protein